ncbi:hypothetical protein FB451DRAFT_1368092 [Mycena latifolia]|nr:hypothetical protein FB451DRAFT_1368092 [Mycena latifolia]
MRILPVVPHGSIEMQVHAHDSTAILTRSAKAAAERCRTEVAGSRRAKCSPTRYPTGLPKQDGIRVRCAQSSPVEVAERDLIARGAGSEESGGREMMGVKSKSGSEPFGKNITPQLSPWSTRWDPDSNVVPPIIHVDGPGATRSSVATVESTAPRVLDGRTYQSGSSSMRGVYISLTGADTCGFSRCFVTAFSLARLPPRSAVFVKHHDSQYHSMLPEPAGGRFLNLRRDYFAFLRYSAHPKRHRTLPGGRRREREAHRAADVTALPEPQQMELPVRHLIDDHYIEQEPGRLGGRLGTPGRSLVDRSTKLEETKARLSLLTPSMRQSAFKSTLSAASTKTVATSTSSTLSLDVVVPRFFYKWSAYISKSIPNEHNWQMSKPRSCSYPYWSYAILPTQRSTLTVRFNVDASTMLSSDEISKIDFAVPAPAPTHRSQTAQKYEDHKTPKASQLAKAKKGKKARPSTPQLRTLDDLSSSTSTALHNIRQRGLEPPAFTLQCKAASREFTELIDLGKSHLVFSILRSVLPTKVLSRGSLSVISQTITSREGIKILAGKLKSGTLECSNVARLFVTLGDIARTSSAPGVEDAVRGLLNSVFNSVCDRAIQLPSLHGAAESIDDDDTRKVLLAIKTDTPVDEYALPLLSQRDPFKKTLLSSWEGKWLVNVLMSKKLSQLTVTSLVALLPLNPKREIKRRKSVNGPPSGIEENLVPKVQSTHARRRHSFNLGSEGIEGNYEVLHVIQWTYSRFWDPSYKGRRNNSLHPPRERTLSPPPTIILSPSEALDAVDAEHGKATGLDREEFNRTTISSSNDDASPGPSVPPTIRVLLPDGDPAEEAEDPEEGPSPLSVSPADALASGHQKKGLERLRAIQNAIIAVLVNPKFSLIFPHLAQEIWEVILGCASGRDPFETCGDAAMNVVITELLLERLAKDGRGPLIRKGIIAPLLSNTTFLHILLSRRYVTYNDAQLGKKYPGNAFEVFAGALAIFRSLDDLKSWGRVALDPIITAAIEMLEEYDANGPKAPRKEKRFADGGDEDVESQSKNSKPKIKRNKQNKGTGDDKGLGPPRFWIKLLNAERPRIGRSSTNPQAASTSVSSNITTLGVAVPSFAAGFDEFSFVHPVSEAGGSGESASILFPPQLSGPPFVFDPLQWLEQA